MSLHRRIAAFVALLCAAGGALDAQAPEPPRITATGQVTLRLPPTHALIFLLVEAAGQNPAEAASRGSIAAAAVRDTLRKAGGAIELEVVPYGVLPTPTTNGQPPLAMAAYQSRSGVRMLAPVSALPGLTSAALARGATSVTAPIFQRDSLPAETLRMSDQALKRAREQAEVAARLMNASLGPLISVSAPSLVSQNFVQQVAFPTQYNYDPGNRPLPEVQLSLSVTATWSVVRQP